MYEARPQILMAFTYASFRDGGKGENDLFIRRINDPRHSPGLKQAGFKGSNRGWNQGKTILAPISEPRLFWLKRLNRKLFLRGYLKEILTLARKGSTLFLVDGHVQLDSRHPQVFKNFCRGFHGISAASSQEVLLVPTISDDVI